MRIFVHDYCGHPCQIQLSRWFAARGHQVHHCYCTDIESPRGNFDGDLPGLSVDALGIGTQVPKYSPARRALHDWRYGAKAASRIRAFRPDVVLSGNASPAIQAALQKAAWQCGGAFVYWVQDIFSVGVDRVLPARVPILGKAVSERFRRHEFAVMARSDAVVVISEDFAERCEAQGVAREKIATQHNWAPLSEIVPMPRDNVWAKANGLADKFVFLFSGTLGMKHNPRLLSALAESLRERNDAVVAVVSQGLGREWLEAEAKAKDLRNLELFDFQPFEQLSNVLGSADVLMAILEPFAGEFSVPSKILSYLCAERPLLGALPPENLASRIIARAGAGKVVPPSDEDGFVEAAKSFIDQPDLRCACAAAGRAYAERTFDIDRIGERFLALSERVARR